MEITMLKYFESFESEQLLKSLGPFEGVQIK